MALLRGLHAPLGRFRTQLCWRVVGLAREQISPLTLGPLAITGVILLVLGPRLWTLAAALAAVCATLVRLAQPSATASLLDAPVQSISVIARCAVVPNG